MAAMSRQLKPLNHMVRITWDNRREDNQREDNRRGLGGSLGLVAAGSFHMAAVRKLVGVGMRLVEVGMLLVQVVGSRLMAGRADQYGTCIEVAAQPLLVVARTCHPFCPFQPCAVSAYKHKPCNKPNLPHMTGSETPLEVHLFQKCKQPEKIYRPIVEGRT